MRTVRNHYEILGLPRNATSAQIKRKYRELARKFHPDVAKDKNTAHRLFLQINESYECLSDPTRRKAYDETLDMDAQIAAKRFSQSAGTYSARPGPGPAQTPAGKTVQLLRDAQFAFIQKRLGQAAELCKEALQIDPRSARACAMLGDIYRAQGRRNDAIKHYNFAIQFNPSDKDSEKKLLSLMDKHISHERSYHVEPSARARANVNAFWWSVVFLLLLLIHAYPGKPIPWLAMYIPRVSMWSWNLVGLLAAASAVGGAVLSINGYLRNPDDELVFDNSGASWAIVPVGLILLVGSGFFFVGAAAFYIIFGALQGNLSRSVLNVFGLVIAVVLFASLMYEPQARSQVMIFGGNVAFLSSLFGWYTGAALKPLSAE